MNQSTRSTNRQLALWSERGEQLQLPEQMREEVIGVLADLLLEAMGVNAMASQTGGGDESEDLG